MADQFVEVLKREFPGAKEENRAGTLVVSVPVDPELGKLAVKVEMDNIEIGFDTLRETIARLHTDAVAVLLTITDKCTLRHEEVEDIIADFPLSVEYIVMCTNDPDIRILGGTLALTEEQARLVPNKMTGATIRRYKYEEQEQGLEFFWQKVEAVAERKKRQQ